MSEPAAPVSGLRIVELIAENVKRIEVVDITPTDDMVVITGRNGQGKSSVLDAIWYALDGARNIPDVPIRRGETKATITLDLGELIVQRTIEETESGIAHSLSVRTPRGAEYRQPQRTIDTFFSALSLDPLVFIRMDQKARFTLLRPFVPEVDFDALELADSEDRSIRRELQAHAKRARGEVDRIEIPGVRDLPAEPIDITALETSLETAGRHNSTIEMRGQRRDQFAADMKQKRKQADDLDRTAEGLRLQLAQMEAQAEQLRAEAQLTEDMLRKAEPLPAPTDTTAILAQLTEARVVNTRIELRTRRDEAKAEAERLEREAEQLTKRIEGRKAATARTLATAKMPVEGLTLSPAGDVLMNELPFEQASDAERLRASIALAMALNPRLKVIRVRDGSLLDDDGMKLLADMARERGYQVWIEKVSNGDDGVGFVMVEGRLRDAADK